VSTSGGAALSQEQPATAPTTELPAVEITTTTSNPIAKPTLRKAAQTKPTAQASPSASQADIPSASENPPIVMPQAALPGTTLDYEPFASTAQVGEREILTAGGATIADTVTFKPGITSTAFAPGASRPIIRGLDSYRVRTLENGIGTHDVAAISEDHAVPIDPDTADRIEVVRGPATLRYGTQAIGGVVAVENERIPTFIPKGGMTALLKGGTTSVDDGADGAFRVTAGSKMTGVAVHADGFKRNADDYETPRGEELNSFVDSQGGSLGASVIGRDGFFGVSFAHIESLYGIPGEEAREGALPRIDMEQQKVLARGEWRIRDFGIDAIRLWFGASDYAHNELAVHDDGDDEDHDAEHGTDGFSLGSRFTNKEQEARIELQHLPTGTLLGQLNGAFGIQLGKRRTRGQSFEGESLLEPAHTQSASAFLFEELSLSERLRFQTALRIEHATVDGTGWEEFHGDAHDDHGHFHGHTIEGARSFTPLSASLGLLYELPTQTVARLTGQYVERAPEAAELFSKGMHEATGTFEVGNPFLREEKAATAEIGLKKASGAFRFDTSAYVTRFNGFIYREFQGLECDPQAHDGEFNCVESGHVHEDDEHDHGDEHGHMLDLVRFQQRDANFYGLEAAAQYDVALIWNGVWGIDGRYDFVHARFVGGGYVPRIPPHRLGGGVYYMDANWLARIGVLHAFDQNRIGDDEEFTTPGYTLVSAELSYTAPATGLDAPGFTIGLKADNLLDDEVLNHASFKRREGVLEPGASIRLFGSIKLN